jgi:hypothetical protein
MDRCADLDGYAGHQQQQDAQQRRIGAGIISLGVIVHDRTK